LKIKGTLISIFFCFCAFFVWGSIVFTQNKLTHLRKGLWAPSSMTLFPQSEKIKPYLMGFHTAYANYLWIRTTIYFGSHFITDQQYEWLIHMVDIVTKLNPNFYPAYEFAGLIIPDVCNNPKAAQIILQRGISSNIDRKWKLYYYLGMIYYRYFNDKKTAALMISQAAMQKNSPGYKMAGIAASLFKKSGSPEEGLELLYFLHNTSENPEVKKFIEGKIKSYLKSMN